MQFTLLGHVRMISHDELREDKEGGKCFVIADINGDLPLLKGVLQYIENAPLASNDKVIFLGNIVGTGEHSKEVIDLLQAYQFNRKEQVVILRGANEHKLITANDKYYASKQALQCINSYRTFKSRPANKSSLNKIDFTKFFKDLKWLASLPSFHITNRYLFVHSGVKIDTPLEKQDTHSCVFVQNAASFGSDRCDTAYITNHGEVKELIMVHSNSQFPFQSMAPRFNKFNYDLGCAVNPGQELPMLILGESGKWVTNKPKVVKIHR